MTDSAGQDGEAPGENMDLQINCVILAQCVTVCAKDCPGWLAHGGI